MLTKELSKLPTVHPCFIEPMYVQAVRELPDSKWHPGDHAPFLGTQEFVKKVAAPKRQNGATRPANPEVLQAKAREAGLEPQAVARRGKSRAIGAVRRGFIEAAVLEQGYQASEVVSLLGCRASNVSRALQKRKSKF